MLQGYRLYDADAHAMMSPGMWETLPKEYVARRPRPTRVSDASDMGRWSNGWLVEGQIIPHALGPGSQPGNEPAIAIGNRRGDVHEVDTAAKHRLRGRLGRGCGQACDKGGNNESCVETLHGPELRVCPVVTRGRVELTRSRCLEASAAQAIRKTLAER